MSDSTENVRFKQVIETAIGTEKVTKFAVRAGLSAGNLSRIRNGQPAKPVTLKKIADASDYVSYDDLMIAAGYYEEGLHDSEDVPTADKMVGIPVVTDLQHPKKQLKKDPTWKKEYYYGKNFSDGDYFYYILSDDSFAPRLNPGDYVLVDMDCKPRDGDIVLLKTERGEELLRRIATDGRKYIFTADNAVSYPMMICPKSEVEIYGTVVEARVVL